MREGGGRRGTSKLREAARKVAVAAAYACGSFSSRRKAMVDPASIHNTSCALSSATVHIPTFPLLPTLPFWKKMQPLSAFLNWGVINLPSSFMIGLFIKIQ